MLVNPPRHLRAITIGLLLAAVACSSESKPSYNIPDQPDGLTVLPANASVEMGYLPLALTLELRRAGVVTYVPASSATWATENDKIATVDKDGNLTAVGAGTTNVTATYALAGGPTFTGKKAVTVTPAVSTVEFSFSSGNGFVVDSGNPQTVSAVAIYTDHTARDVTADTSFALRGYPSGNATASVAGNVISTDSTVATPGETKSQLVGTYHGKAYSVPFTTLKGAAPVTGDLAGLAFFGVAPKNDVDLTALTVKVPQATKFKVYSQATYTNGAAPQNDVPPAGTLAGVTYASSDKTILTVSGNTVTAVKPGTATVTAEYVEGGIKKTAAPLTVTVTGDTLTHLFITTSTDVQGSSATIAPLNGKSTTTAVPANFVFASDATPATANFKMPLDASYAVKAIGVFSDGTYRDISRSVTWKLANTNADDDKNGLVHADIAAGGSAAIGTVTPPANDPAQYTPGDVTVTATFAQADGTKMKATLPITVADLAATPTVDGSSGAMTVTFSYAGSGLGTNAVTAYDASFNCVYETADESVVQVDNVPGGANQTVIYQVPPSAATATITAYFLPTEDSTANGWKAGVPKSVGTATAP